MFGVDLIERLIDKFTKVTGTPAQHHVVVELKYSNLEYAVRHLDEPNPPYEDQTRCVALWKKMAQLIADTPDQTDEDSQSYSKIRDACLGIAADIKNHTMGYASSVAIKHEHLLELRNHQHILSKAADNYYNTPKPILASNVMPLKAYQPPSFTATYVCDDTLVFERNLERERAPETLIMRFSNNLSEITPSLHIKEEESAEKNPIRSSTFIRHILG